MFGRAGHTRAVTGLELSNRTATRGSHTATRSARWLGVLLLAVSGCGQEAEAPPTQPVAPPGGGGTSGAPTGGTGSTPPPSSGGAGDTSVPEPGASGGGGSGGAPVNTAGAPGATGGTTTMDTETSSPTTTHADTTTTDTSTAVETGTNELVEPTVTGSTYRLSFGDIGFAADATTGRITEFVFQGNNLLTGPEVNAANYGSSFWTSPQTWDWPPAMDDASYTHEIDAQTASIVFTSSNVSLGSDSVVVNKRFWADPARAAIVHEYTITNTGSSAMQVAPWQITRVPYSGLTFYPIGSGGEPEAQMRPYAPGPITAVTIANDIVWYDFTQARNDAEKSIGDGSEGWLAHVADGVLFLKTFPDIPANQQAPDEAEIEVFAGPATNESGAYIELEPQGAYASLAAGATSQPWRVSWYAHAVPAELDVSVGSAELVEWVRSLLDE